MPADQLTVMAPGAGSGIGKKIADNLLARPGFVDRLCDALDHALTSTLRRWDKDAKDWSIEQDTRCQLQAAFGILAHMEGEPVKRILHAQISAGKDPTDMLFQSPELVASLERRLDQAKRHHAGPGYRKPKQVQAVAVEQAPEPNTGPRGMAKAAAEDSAKPPA